LIFNNPKLIKIIWLIIHTHYMHPHISRFIFHCLLQFPLYYLQLYQIPELFANNYILLCFRQALSQKINSIAVIGW